MGTVDVAGEFESFGPSHVTVLVLFAVGAVGVVLLGRRIAGCPVERVVSRVLAVAILTVTVPLQVLQLLPDEWDRETSLPFQLCDLAWMTGVVALWTGNRLAATLTYLWGVTLTTQGMVTPDLDSQFPEVRFLMFWAMHLLIVWAALYLVLGIRVLPTWATYRATVAFTAAWALLVFCFNLVADTNYGYLNELPDSSSLLDLLGPWPLYVLLEVGIIAAVWAALTWPWTRLARTATH